MEEFGIESVRKQETKNKKQKNNYSGTVQLDLMGDARPLKEIIKEKESQMRDAAQKLEFELAAILRDEIRELVAKNKVKTKKKV